MPLLLSRDGETFFHTSESFYFYPPPGNFSLAPIFPGGGPVGLPTFVTIYGSGFLGFDGAAAHVRCRWSRPAPTPSWWPLGFSPSHGGAVAADVTEPSVLTDTMMVCESYEGTDAKTIVLDVSLNTGQVCGPTCTRLLACSRMREHAPVGMQAPDHTTTLSTGAARSLCTEWDNACASHLH